MLKYDLKNHKFHPLEKSNLKDQKILERYDLQETIIKSWEIFRNEIDIPSAFLIGSEIRPDNSTNDSLDLLVIWDTSTEILNDLCKRRAGRQFVDAGFVHVSANAEQNRS